VRLGVEIPFNDTKVVQMKKIAGVIGVASAINPLRYLAPKSRLKHGIRQSGKLPIKKDRKTKRNPLSSTFYPVSLPIA
jgi:hypothetical protein